MGGSVFFVVGVVLLTLGGELEGRVVMPGYGLDDELSGIDLTKFEGKGLGDQFIMDALVPFYLQEMLSIIEQFPPVVEILLDGVDNQDCSGHVREWTHRASHLLNISNDEVWVYHMLDSWGKPPEGILSGHLNALGDFDECVDIAVTDLPIEHPDNENKTIAKNFEGHYCNTYLLPYSDARFGQYFQTKKTTDSTKEVSPLMEELRKHVGSRKATTPSHLLELMGTLVGVLMLPSMGTCFPNTCSQSNMEKVMMNAFALNYELLLGPDFNKTELIWPGVTYCYERKKPDLDAADISVISLLSVIVGICLFASILDMYLNRGLEKPPKRGLAFQYFNSFSLYTNIPKWLSTQSNADDLGCLHGIRVMSTTWVILAHTWYVITFMPYWNMVDTKEIQQHWMILTVLNSTIAVDTFFVLSGLLVSYNVLKMFNKTKGKLNLPMFYIHRYLRLTPVYAVLVGVMATLVPYLGSGPSWFIMDRWATICQDNWWTNVLYVNNFVNTSWLCQGEAWYLANDMQFYIVSPFFIYPLWRWEMIGIVILTVSTILSSLSPALLVHYFDTVPTTIGTRDSQKWFTDIYIKPYARIQTYFVGIWIGWLLYKTKGKKVNLPLPLVLLCWIVAAASCLAVLYGIRPWFDPENEIPKWPGLIYAALSRLAWGISVSWVIFACVKGYGWLINDFLCWKVFIPLGRLCYCVFLVSLHLQMVLHLQMKMPIGYQEYTMVNFFFGHLMMSFLVGFFFTLTIETPLMKIEKLIFEGGDRGPRGGPPQPVTGFPSSIKVQGGEGNRNGIFYNKTDDVLEGKVPTSALTSAATEIKQD